jgi:hypothetical protein
MSNKEIINDKSNVFNLIAIGAFLWYFLKSLSYLFFISYKSIGIISGMEPVVLFWTSQVLYIAVMCIVLRICITTIWNQIELNLINIKKLLIKIVIAIALVQIFQTLHGFFVPEYLFRNFENSLTSYHNIVNSIDRFNLIDSSFDIVGSLILLLLFIKWK